MKNTLTKADLKVLLAGRKGPCVSLYMPTHPTGRETEQDHIRYKNLLNEAEKRLASGGMRAPEARAMLAEAAVYIDDSLFWEYQSSALALFVAGDFFKIFSLPVDASELLVVSDRFHIKPLLPLFTGNGKFYILAVSQHGIRLLEATRVSARSVELKGMPHSLKEALKYDEPERVLQFHSGVKPGGGSHAVFFHGHGFAGGFSKDRILRFFREVDKHLHDFLRNERAPLVLAGVAYLFPIYREANTYPHLLEEGVSGNPDRVSTDELRVRALDVLQPYLHKAQTDAAARYNRVAGTERVSNELGNIVSAAFQGRVELLFIAAGANRWGKFDPATGEVTLHREQAPGDEGLLDFAAFHTLLHGGEVFTLNEGEIPGGGVTAALLRY